MYQEMHMWEEAIEVAEAKVIRENVLDLEEMFEERFKETESVFLEQNHVDEAMEMYQEMHMWEELLKLLKLRYCWRINWEE